jgi:hypothetical protein
LFSDRLLPAVLALFGGTLLAVILLVPFVFQSYRRRGEVGSARHCSRSAS